jgi:hypothetical protein
MNKQEKLNAIYQLMDIDFEDMLRDPSDEFVDSMYKNYV